jgi:hypothetical protein
MAIFVTGFMAAFSARCKRDDREVHGNLVPENRHGRSSFGYPNAARISAA